MPDLEKLDAYLLSDDAHSDSMGLSDLDGFLNRLAKVRFCIGSQS
jgi:hypothetical protein